ncbi:MAG TPA: polymer-forming cytoskeletal protein [Hyphomicrobiaceae bacterium]|nr:polymer-forming cytoskeletal protein [Hyphomicrobiaceae bacterium]
MNSNGSAFIGDDLIIEGDLRSKGAIEVGGIVTGSVSAASLTVSEGGRVFGVVRTDSAEVNGTLQGTLLVRNLIRIGSTGSVTGDVRYGQLVLELGGELSAEVTNVPPALVGDMQIVVRRGQSVRVTTDDINAIDPDDSPTGLTFIVACPAGGHMARVETPDVPLERFTKADVLEGAIIYVHDGRPGRNASVSISVTDSGGATSGAPQQLQVAVTDA